MIRLIFLPIQVKENVLKDKRKLKLLNPPQVVFMSKLVRGIHAWITSVKRVIFISFFVDVLQFYNPYAQPLKCLYFYQENSVQFI